MLDFTVFVCLDSKNPILDVEYQHGSFYSKWNINFCLLWYQKTLLKRPSRKKLFVCKKLFFFTVSVCIPLPKALDESSTRPAHDS